MCHNSNLNSATESHFWGFPPAKGFLSLYDDFTYELHLLIQGLHALGFLTVKIKSVVAFIESIHATLNIIQAVPCICAFVRCSICNDIDSVPFDPQEEWYEPGILPHRVRGQGDSFYVGPELPEFERRCKYWCFPAFSVLFSVAFRVDVDSVTFNVERTNIDWIELPRL